MFLRTTRLFSVLVMDFVLLRGNIAENLQNISIVKENDCLMESDAPILN